MGNVRIHRSMVCLDNLQRFVRDTKTDGEAILCLHGRWGRGKTRVDFMQHYGDRYRVIAPDRIACPVLILRGLATTHAIPPDLSEPDSQRYQRLLKNVQEVGFAGSGHMIPDDEPDQYADTVRSFLTQLDGYFQPPDQVKEEQ